MKHLTNNIKVIMLVAITALLALIVLFVQNSQVYCAVSAEQMASADANNNLFFSDVVQPKWLTRGEQIYYVKEDYSFKNVDNDLLKTKENALAYVEPKYSQGMVSYGAVNEENYFLYATDSSGTEVKLLPVLADEDWTNANAENSVTIRFDYKRSLAANMEFNNDSRKLKDVQNGLGISGCNTKVDRGKILYRTGKTTSEMNNAVWNFIDLQDGATLSFNAPTQITICIIYEIWEKGSNIFQFRYSHCLAQYCLNVAVR